MYLNSKLLIYPIQPHFQFLKLYPPLISSQKPTFSRHLLPRVWASSSTRVCRPCVLGHCDHCADRLVSTGNDHRPVPWRRPRADDPRPANFPIVVGLLGIEALRVAWTTLVLNGDVACRAWYGPHSDSRHVATSDRAGFMGDNERTRLCWCYSRYRRRDRLGCRWRSWSGRRRGVTKLVPKQAELIVVSKIFVCELAFLSRP